MKCILCIYFPCTVLNCKLLHSVGPGPLAYNRKTTVGQNENCLTYPQAPAYSMSIPLAGKYTYTVRTVFSRASATCES